MASYANFHNESANMNHLWYTSHKNLIMNMCIEFGAVERLDELTNKYLGKPIKLKKLKDPAMPKRTHSAFFYFCDEQRPGEMDKVRKKGGKVNIGNIAKILGSMWKTLSSEDREKYIVLNKKDKERYQDEMEVYNN